LLGAGQEIEEWGQVGGRGEVLVVGHCRRCHGGGIEAFAARFLLLLVSVPGMLSALVLFEVEEHDQQGNNDNRRQGCHAAPPDAPGGMFFRPRAVRSGVQFGQLVKRDTNPPAQGQPRPDQHRQRQGAQQENKQMLAPPRFEERSLAGRPDHAGDNEEKHEGHNDCVQSPGADPSPEDHAFAVAPADQ
jgi:hypothetical protein